MAFYHFHCRRTVDRRHLQTHFPGEAILGWCELIILDARLTINMDWLYRFLSRIGKARWKLWGKWCALVPNRQKNGPSAGLREASCLSYSLLSFFLFTIISWVGPDGKFADADLARILQDATFNPAGAYGARRVPHSMKIIEMLSIQQNRDWGTCSMNEFRKVSYIFTVIPKILPIDAYGPAVPRLQAIRLIWRVEPRSIGCWGSSPTISPSW